MNAFAQALISNEKSKLIPEEHNIFKDLIGSWDFINVFDNGNKKIQGEWIFSWILEGTAIQDIFILPSRQERLKNPLKPSDYEEYGTSIRIYNPATKAWDVFYGNTGGATRLEARKESGKIVLTEINEQKMKWIFSDITATSFHWQYTTLDEKGARIVQGELWATRKTTAG